MKKVLLVCGFSTEAQNVEACQEMQAFMQTTLGNEFEVLSTHLDLISYVLAPGVFVAHDSRNDVDLRTVDQIFIRGPKIRLTSGHAHYLSRFCAWNNVECLNDYSLYYSGTKIAQTIVFLEEDLPFLKTIYAANKEVLLDQAEQELEYPYILKTATGSHGDSNYLVRTRRQAQKIIAEESTTDFLAQSYCPNDRDYRLLLLKDSNLIFERRGASDSHLNNTSKGGEAALARDVLPGAIIEKAHRIAKRLGLAIAGVDVMPHIETGEYYFLEVNSQPQLRTGALLEEKKQELRKLFGTSP